jgi:multicomponent K+:H+ antiporter subunit A
MASGFAWAQERMKIDYHALIGMGVLVAGITGIGAWYGDVPFLTSSYGYFHLPLVGEVELATAMGFDLGVFLTVVGVVMLTLANLSRVGRKAEPEEIPQEPMDIVLPPAEKRPVAVAQEA